MPESRTPYTTANKWDTIRHRLETAAKSVGGAGCKIEITIYAVDGVALSWERPVVTPLEPRRDAAKFARFLTFGLGGVVEIDDSGKAAQGE